MKYLLSRFGGHGIILGKGKSSNQNLPEDQSLENVLDKHAFKMKGFTYLSSYQMMPEFMGPFVKLHDVAIKIAEIEHDFNEISLQYEVTLNTSVYFSQFVYTNIFGIFLKTNYRDVEDMIGKIEPSYDCVLVIHAIEKDAEEIKKVMPQLLHIALMGLIYEMGIKDSYYEITPTKTTLGKKIDVNKLNEGLENLKTIENREQLSKVLFL
jgi:hypothetical protein